MSTRRTAFLLVWLAFLTHAADAQSAPTLPRGQVLSCSPAPCVLPPTQASEGGAEITSPAIVANPLNPYPLVRITNNATRHIFYCRTHDHSTMAVGYFGPAFTYVDVPATAESGQSTLEVIANGIASPPYDVVVE